MKIGRIIIGLVWIGFALLAHFGEGRTPEFYVELTVYVPMIIGVLILVSGLPASHKKCPVCGQELESGKYDKHLREAHGKP